MHDAIFMYADDPNDILPFLDTSVWDQSQARLSHLLPTEEVKQILVYYALVQVVSFGWQRSPRSDLTQDDKQRISKIRNQGARLSNLAQKYIGDTDALKPSGEGLLGKDAEETSPT